MAVCVPAGELDRTIAFHERVFGLSVIFREYIEIGDQEGAGFVVRSDTGDGNRRRPPTGSRPKTPRVCMCSRAEPAKTGVVTYTI